MLAEAAMALLLERCAPAVAPLTMRALIAHESDTQPNVIDDDTTRQMIHPASRKEAEDIAERLLAASHTIDVGYAQINSANFRTFGLDAHTAFDPCTNVATGADILASRYAKASLRFGPGQTALAYALSAYNAGGGAFASGYVRAVMRRAGELLARNRIR